MNDVDEKNQPELSPSQIQVELQSFSKAGSCSVELSLLSVLQLPQHVQVPAGTKRESLKCCQEC